LLAPGVLFQMKLLGLGSAKLIPGKATAFAFTGARVERAANRKLAVRHKCGALNEIAVKGETEEGHDLNTVVGEMGSVHCRCA
jgi:hypothetical protein